MVDSCVILCGGKSSRLHGENDISKILLPFGEMPLIAYNFAKMKRIFKRVFIACKDNQHDLIKKSLQDLGKSIANLSDIFIIESSPIFAPIVGLVSAFTQLKDDSIFFIACDCPFVAPSTIEMLCKDLQDYDIIFAKDSRKAHPLIAVWSAKTLPLLQDCLQKGDFRLQNIIAKVRAKSLHFSNSSEFLNINTKADYERALERLG